MGIRPYIFERLSSRISAAKTSGGRHRSFFLFLRNPVSHPILIIPYILQSKRVYRRNIVLQRNFPRGWPTCQGAPSQRRAAHHCVVGGWLAVARRYFLGGLLLRRLQGWALLLFAVSVLLNRQHRCGSVLAHRMHRKRSCSRANPSDAGLSVLALDWRACSAVFPFSWRGSRR